MSTVKDVIEKAMAFSISGKLIFNENDSDIPEGIGYRVRGDNIIIYPIKNGVPSWNLDDIVVIPQKEWVDYDVCTMEKNLFLCVDNLTSTYATWHYYRSRVDTVGTASGDEEVEMMREIFVSLKDPNRCKHANVIFGMFADFFREENQLEWDSSLFENEWGMNWIAKSADGVHQDYKSLGNYAPMINAIRSTIRRYEEDDE